MAKKQTSLKTKNALYLWTFIGANFAVFLAIIIGAQLNYASVEQSWQRVSTKDGIIAACMPFITVILNGILGDLAKARLVFWRWKNPLPGCRAFTVLMHTDPRIDVDALKAKHGSLPRSPKDQNVLWFQIYKKHAGSLTVSEGHRLYLLSRDMASISAVFAIAFSICAVFSSIQKEMAFFYFAFLLMQYLILSTSARNYGNRFVLNVLTEESHAK
jgi:hypothetical protein